jgi:hypothetical protein
MSWMHPSKTQSGRLDYILLSNSLAGKLKYCKTTDCPANISDHQGVEACINLNSSPSGPGSFRAAPLVEKDPGYQNSVRHLLNEELILLSQISDKTKDEKLEKKQRLFDLRQDQTLDKDEKVKLLTELSNSMMSKQDLIDPGLNIATKSALDYIVFKDALLDIEKKLDTAHNNGDLEAIEVLNEDHKTSM